MADKHWVCLGSFSQIAQFDLFSYPFVIIEVTFILAFLDLGSFWVRLGLNWVCFGILLALIGFDWL
jgi:hypothetical protein